MHIYIYTYICIYKYIYIHLHIYICIYIYINPTYPTYLEASLHCNILWHTVTHCDTLWHTVTHCNTLQHTATHCNTLQHTATHFNTLQHTATHCDFILDSRDHHRKQLPKAIQAADYWQRWHHCPSGIPIESHLLPYTQAVLPVCAAKRLRHSVVWF